MNRKEFCSYQESNPNAGAVQAVASCYSHCGKYTDHPHSTTVAFRLMYILAIYMHVSGMLCHPQFCVENVAISFRNKTMYVTQIQL
jgi:hypothetical protein